MPLFNWNAQDRYVKLMNFEVEVTNILKMKAYQLTNEEKVPVIRNWLGQEVLQVTKTFTHKEKEKHLTPKSLFSILCDKFKP